MKKIILAMLLSVPAFAGLKVTLKPQYHTEQKGFGGALGASLYQPLFTDWVALNLWSGVGYRPKAGEPGVIWAGANTQIDFRYNKWIFSPGAQFRYSPTFSDDDNSISFGVSYKVW